MKKLLTLFLVLTAFAAGAQVIAEKQLLGEWKPLYTKAMGCSYTFKNGEVVLSKEMEEMAVQSDANVEYLKKLFAENMQQMGIAEMKVVFKPGFVLEWYQDGDVASSEYELISDNGKSIISDPEMGGAFEVGFNGTYLELSSEDTEAGLVILGFEKAK
jgi:hypothetical protein